jgi:hypothetical protein
MYTTLATHHDVADKRTSSVIYSNTVHSIAVDKFLVMFDAGGINILGDCVDRYVVISYITHLPKEAEHVEPFDCSGVQITPRGLESDDLRTGLEFLETRGIETVWLNVFSAPDAANMTRSEHTKAP